MRWWPFVKQLPGPPTAPLTNGGPAPAVEAATGSSVSMDRTSNAMLREYTRSIYLWRCVDMIAQMSSSIVLEVKPETDRDLNADEHAIQELLERPNPQWTSAALQYFVAASLAVANRAVLKRVRSEVGSNRPTLELWPIPANEVTAKYDPDSLVIIAWERATSKGKEVYPVDEDGDSDLIVIRRPALNTQTDKSPAAIAVAPAEVFTRILQRCFDIVSNSSNITGLLSTEAEMAEAAVKKIKERIQQFRTGRGDSGGTLVTANAKWEMTRLSEDPATALSVEIKDSLARDVAMTFGVPTQLVGIPGQDTYNNLALARVGLLTETVLPGYVSFYVAALNLALMRDFEAEICPDIGAIPSMAASRLQLVDTASRATMLTINEQRKLLGYPRYEDDELADVPVMVENLRLKRLAIEAQAGGPTNLLAGEPT